MAWTDSTVYTGKHGVILIKKETSWGTVGSGSYLDLGLVQNLSWNGNNTLTRHHTVGSRNTEFINAGNFDLSGSIELLLQHGRPLYYVFGADSVATGDDPDFVHSITEATALPSFTLYEGQNSTTDNLQTTTGCIFSSAAISLALGGVLTFSGDFMAKSVTSATTTPETWTHSTIPAFTPWQASVDLGAAVAYVQNFDITVANSPTKIWGLGGRVPKDAVANQATYDFRFRAGFAGNTELEQFLGSTTPNDTTNPTAITATFDITNAVAIQSGLRRILVALTGGQLATVGRAIPVNGWVFQDFAGMATAGTATVTDTNETDYDDEDS